MYIAAVVLCTRIFALHYSNSFKSYCNLLFVLSCFDTATWRWVKYDRIWINVFMLGL